jgi:meiosis induction protein kinase IME2/SME1
LAFIHGEGVEHRDLKPDNLLIDQFTTSLRFTVKLSDFGLARLCTDTDKKTIYVSTRWYRSPELLLKIPSYSRPIDLWSAGCVIWELTFWESLFPGDTELEQLDMITRVIGSPIRPVVDSPTTSIGFNSAYHHREWVDGVEFCDEHGLTFPRYKPQSFADKVKRKVGHCVSKCQLGDDMSQWLTRMLEGLLRWDPKKRLTAQSILTTMFPAPLIKASQVPIAKDETVRQPAKIPRVESTIYDGGDDELQIQMMLQAYH